MLVELYGELWGAPRAGRCALTAEEWAAVPLDACLRSVVVTRHIPERTVEMLMRFPTARLSARLPSVDCVWLRRRGGAGAFLMADHARLGESSPARPVAAREDLVRLICDAMD